MHKNELFRYCKNENILTSAAFYATIYKNETEAGMKTENKKFKHRIMLAPMAGFTDRAMRLICREYGAEYSVTEMVSAKAVTYGDRKTASLAGIGLDEGDVGLQIFGSDPDIMARAAEILTSNIKEGFAMPAAIDINMGCPVHKIYSNGEGSALMKNPELIEKITRATVNASPIPVSVKMRLGIDREHINVIECAQAAESGGASFIAIHGRTKTEMYSGDTDLETIKNVKRALHIPLIANGDITDAASALRAFEITRADGIMIGRGAIGNPFIFSEIAAALEGRVYTPPSLEEKIEAALRQLEYAVADKGEAIAIPEARKQTALYLKGFRGAAQVRGEINRATSFDDVKLSLEKVFNENRNI